MVFLKKTTCYLLLVFAFIFHAFAEGDFKIITKNNLQGLSDAQGKILIPPLYDKIGWSDGSTGVANKVIGYKKGYKWGLINTSNLIVSKAIYTGLKPFDSQTIIASKRDQFSNRNIFGLISTKQKVLLSFKYSSLQSAGANLIGSVEKYEGDRYGLISQNDKVILSFKYENIDYLENEFISVRNSDGKSALFTTSGNGLSNFVFDQISNFDRNHFQVTNEGKYGLINLDGKLVIETEHKSLRNLSGQLEVLPFPKWEIIDHQNKVISEYWYDELIPSEHDLYRTVSNNIHGYIRKDGLSFPYAGKMRVKEDLYDFLEVTNGLKVGLIDNKGVTILEAIYDSISYIPPYIYASIKSHFNSRWEVFNHFGSRINKKQYESIKPFSNGFFRVKSNEHWGFMDGLGFEVIDCKFNSAEDFIGNYSIVSYYDGHGLIDRAGKWRINPYQQIKQRINEVSFIFTKNQRYGIIHVQDGVIYSSGNKLEKHSLGILETDSFGKKGILSNRGQTILHTEYDGISEIHDGIAIIHRNGGYGMINAKDRSIIPVNPHLTNLQFPTEEYFPAQIDGKYSFIDMEGRMRIANRYDSVNSFAEGIAPVKLTGHWGAINKQEEIIVQPIYDKIEGFKNSLSIVSQNNKMGIIDTDGKVIHNLELDAIRRLHSGRFIYSKNGQKGLLDKMGNRLIYPKYDDIIDLNNGLMIIKRNSLYGLLTLSGLSVIPLDFDEIAYDRKSNTYLCKKVAKWKSAVQ